MILRRLALAAYAYSVIAPSGAQAADNSFKELSPNQAIKLHDICSNNAGDRTTRVYINNSTDWTIVISFAQLKDESSNIPDGYITDTGTFVLATNDSGPSQPSVDPCYNGGFQRPIQATRCIATLKMTDGNTEQDVTLPDISDGDTSTYYPTCGWDVGYSAVTKKFFVNNTKTNKK